MIPLGVASSGYAFTNILPSADNHASATWGSGSGWTASVSDVDGGTTAEQWVEHSGSGTRSIYTTAGFSTTAGVHQMDLYYKQKSGSDSARRLLFEIANGPSTWNSGVDLTLDETGAIIDYSGYGSAVTILSSEISPSTNGFYRVSCKFNTTATTILVYMEHRNDSSATYTGDGSSGWIIDNHRLYKI